jgi:homospermidine synthase
MKILMVGSGAVAQCTLPILLKELPINPSDVTVIDFVDNRHRIASALERGVKYVLERVTNENYQHILSTYLSAGDMFIDLSWNIDTIALLTWCYEHDVNYVNSSVELWDPYMQVHSKNPCQLTLYARQMDIINLIDSLPNKNGATAIVDHGANPGLVSHFAKQALEDIAHKIIADDPKDARIKQLQEALQYRNYAMLAQLLDVRVIQIAERDSQITSNPKRMNEFVNTWSVQGLYEEGIAPAELGWGTHERFAPAGIRFHEDGPKNQVCLTSRGIDTLVRSWVPSGDTIGMVIRHGEAYGISERLTVWQQGVPVYRPTVYFAYCLSDSAIASIYELKMRQLDLQPNMRIITDDIIDGKDELGCFLLGHDYKAWWIGSLLDIHEARRLVPHQNATTVQVAIAVVAAVRYMMDHPNEGICLPDDIDHHEILAFAKPYLGPFVSKAVDWSPLRRKPTYFEYDGAEINPHEEWQFTSFLVSPFEKIKLK